MAQGKAHVWDDHTKRVKSWENGEIFRPGKTRHEKQNGVWANHMANRAAKADENRHGPSKGKK